MISKKMAISVILTLGICSPQTVQSATPPIGELLLLAKELATFFGGEQYEPDLLADNDPCRLNFSLTNLRGVFGNGKFKKNSFSINDFWTGSLTLDGREGFVKNDILQISGSIQHKTDFCDQRTNDKGAPITFLINLDLNNMNIVRQIDPNGQIELKDSKLPKTKEHNTSNGIHQDILESVSLNANIFSNNSEIGLYNIDIKASHNSSPPPKTPEPTSTLALLTLSTLGAASTFKRKLKPSKSSEKETTKVG